eukprot:TRINITY_DN712_c0_g1_i1.p2 TRINITY_DN712_c0_g1~~TRINITY_DN712_c0_g1_i1.p2  ORF type:complete len:293 (-),score=28.74 TRINITY_DN712_c0_g1_i1:321-1199(-)
MLQTNLPAKRCLPVLYGTSATSRIGSFLSSQTPKKLYLKKKSQFNNKFQHIVPFATAEPNLANGVQAEEEDADVCFPAFVYYDNEVNPDFTTVQIEISDYPGLVRVIAWVLEGLDLVVRNALLSTSEEGVVQNTFYVTDSRNKKLSNSVAEDVVDRLREFVTYCSPGQEEMEATELCNGAARLSNTADPTRTEVIINQTKDVKPNLLQIACVISGTGAVIREGVIQSCENCAQGVDSPEFQPGNMLFRFLVTDRDGKKLDYQRASSLLYTLSLVNGNNGFPTSVPRVGLSTS